MTHDELMVKINQRYWKMFNHNSLDQTESSIEHRTFIQNQYFALRAIVELTNNLQDTESWQDDVDYKNGYNNAMNDIRLTIEKELG